MEVVRYDTYYICLCEAESPFSKNWQVFIISFSYSGNIACGLPTTLVSWRCMCLLNVGSGILYFLAAAYMDKPPFFTSSMAAIISSFLFQLVLAVIVSKHCLFSLWISNHVSIIIACLHAQSNTYHNCPPCYVLIKIVLTYSINIPIL